MNSEHNAEDGHGGGVGADDDGRGGGVGADDDG